MKRASAGIHAGKVALVTASTEGIGLAIARRLAQDGAHVVLSSRKKANVDRAVAELRAENLSVFGVVCHVGKEDDRQRLVTTAVEKFGGIDLLVSNAAVNPFVGPFLETPEGVWDKILDVNVKAAFLLVKLVVPHMQQRGGGAVVIVSTIGGYAPSQKLGAYCVSKTALLGLTKALALAPELAAMNIRVNGIAPGLFKTKFSSVFWQDETIRNRFLDGTSLQRIGTPEECAGTVSFLCSSDAAYITGETIVVAGGAQSRL